MSLLCKVGLFVLAATNIAAAEASPEYPEIVRTKYGGTQRIVSGWEARQGQFPYMLSIRMVDSMGNVTACGGSIIHPQWGFTSAHCTALHKTLVIRAGVTDLNQPELIFETSTWYNHPDFIAEMPHVAQLNDIALIDFERFLTFTDNVQAVKIQHSWDRNMDYSGQQMIATGWGATATGGSATQILNWVYLKGVTFMECSIAYGYHPVVGETTVCAGPFNVTSQSICTGDSGGPLVVYEDGEAVQIGITSFVSGWGCESPEPSGFVRPGHYHEWITEITGLNFDELNESSESVQVVSSEESNESVQLVSDESESSESVQVVSTESDSSESVQVVSTESDSSESVQVVSTESDSSESVQVVSTESESSESVQVVSTESDSSESVQVVSSETDSSESVQVVSTESDSSESVQVVSTESGSSESVQVVSAESDSSESVQVVSTESESVQVASTESESSESVQVVSTESGSSESVQDVSTESDSSESVQVVSTESDSSESVQVVSTESESVQVASTESDSSESVQVVSTESDSSESVQVVSNESESVQVVSSQESSEEYIPLIKHISNIFVD